MARYVKSKEAAETLGVHERTLRQWESDGRIEAIRTPSRQRPYNIKSYAAKSGTDSRKVIAYPRVSSRAQQPDLNQQVGTLSNLYPQAEVIAEIGGGFNFKRKKLLALLERILSNDVQLVVVAHFDRLARRGFDLFRWICEPNGCNIVVLNETSLSREREMVEDILAILHWYSSRVYGLRKYKA